MSEPDDIPGIPEKILTRVRALLAKAESSEFPDEAATFQAKAFELMGVHGIEQAVLAARGERPDEITSTRIVLEGGYARKFGALVHFIATALGARSIYTRAFPGDPLRGMPPRAAYSTVIGYRSTLDRIEFLYTLLYAQAVRGLGVVSGVGVTSTRSMRTAYLVGFGETVGLRLAEAETRARRQYDAGRADGATGAAVAAVALADRRVLVDRRYREMFPDARKGKATRVNLAGYNAGLRDGRTADLGGARFDGLRARRIESAG